VLGCLRWTIPALSRSALHRCLVRHGISRLPQNEEKASKRQRFAEAAIGYVHIDVCELRLAEGKLFIFLAIDRVSKFTKVAFLDANTKMNGASFLREVVEVFPYAIHAVLTDNGMAFADLPQTGMGQRDAILAPTSSTASAASTASSTASPGPITLWTNGQAERMNRTVKNATIKAFHYPDLDALRAHVLAFVQAHNFAKHLTALR
jgi:transposase-like protein